MFNFCYDKGTVLTTPAGFLSGSFYFIQKLIAGATAFILQKPGIKQRDMDEVYEYFPLQYGHDWLPVL